MDWRASTPLGSGAGLPEVIFGEPASAFSSDIPPIVGIRLFSPTDNQNVYFNLGAADQFGGGITHNTMVSTFGKTVSGVCHFSAIVQQSGQRFK